MQSGASQPAVAASTAGSNTTAASVLVSSHRQQAPGGTDTMISNDKNLMPSMVVRQQRSRHKHQNLSASTETGNQIYSLGKNNNNNNNNNGDGHHDLNQEFTTTQELMIKTRQASDSGSARINQQAFDQNGLILPKRVPKQHPQLLLLANGSSLMNSTSSSSSSSSSNAATAIQDLNRELKFNQARGKNVLGQKSELKRAMEKLEANRRKKEAEQERLVRRSSLELRLEERAQLIAAAADANRSRSGGGQTSEAQTTDDSTADVMG